MPVSGLHITSNIAQWKRGGFTTANYFSSAEMTRHVGLVLTQRFRVILQEQFRKQGGSGRSGTWKTLSDRYKAWKEKNFPGRPILQLTGALKKSWTTPTNNIAFYSNTPTGLVFRFGSLDRKAEWHQKGVAINNLPARRQLDFTDQQLRGAALSVARTMEDGIFSRLWFDKKQARFYGISIRYTGWEKVDLP